MATEIAPAIEVAHIDDRISVLRLGGDLTLDAELSLSEIFSDASLESMRVVLLDFSELRYMNSGGIGLLVTLLVRANRRGQRLLAYGVNDHYREIFDLTRLAEAIPIYGSEREALAAARRGVHS